MSNNPKPQIEQVKLADLDVHPIAARLPMLADEHPRMLELRAAVVDDFQHPVTIDQKNRIVVGRHRCRAAKLEGVLIVPAIRRPLTDAEAAAMIVGENLTRQDMPESKRALTIVAAHDEWFASRKGRRGGNHAISPQIPKVLNEDFGGASAFDPDPELLSDGSRPFDHLAQSKTMRDMARHYQISYQYLVWAAAVWEARADYPGLLDEVWNGRSSLGQAFTGMRGAVAANPKQKSKGDPNHMFAKWLGATTTSLPKLQKVSAKVVEKNLPGLVSVRNALNEMLKPYERRIARQEAAQ